MRTVYIVTNCDNGRNCTPVICTSREEAFEWLYRLALYHALDVWKDEMYASLINKIEDEAGDLLVDIENWMRAYNKAKDDSIKDELSNKAVEIIDWYNDRMKKSKIPYYLVKDNPIHLIENQFFHLTCRNYCAFNCAKGDEKKALEFFIEHCDDCNIEIEGASVCITYSDDCYNHSVGFEVFETTMEE